MSRFVWRSFGLAALGLASLLLATAPAGAHPLAPALLEIEQREDRSLDVFWKTPSKREPGVELVPRLPERCEPLGGAREWREGPARLLRFRVDCGATPLDGESISIEGIERSRAGVLVRIRLARNAAVQHQMLDAETPALTIDSGGAGACTWASFVSFLELGVEHLVTGWDHALFVVAITLLIGWGSRLVWTLTSFTLGHSITLALATLGFVRFPTPLVEALISLSIVYAASELVRGRARHSGLLRAPWLLAGLFGLLHGMGFAGALSEIGLPAGEIPGALLGFNLGIELGQLAVVCTTLAAGRLLALLSDRPIARLRPLAGYALGSLAAVWFWQQIVLMPVR